MTVTHIDNIFDAIEEFERRIREDTERTLAEIVTKYDFIVGSMELKEKLVGILPCTANIVYSPFIDNPTTIYAIKKFDVTDYLFRAESEDEE